MMKHFKFFWFASLALVTLLTASTARAEFVGIHDNASFFSESAKSEATRNLVELDRRFKRDLAVETFKTIPDDIKQGVDLADKVAAGKMFEAWAVKQARQFKVSGVYVLLVKEPAHLQVIVGNQTQTKAFTLQDRDNLVSIMLGKLREKKNDEALLAATSFVLTTMAGHANPVTRSQNYAIPASARPPQTVQTNEGGSSFWPIIIVVVLGLGFVWVIFNVIRAMSGGGGLWGGGGGYSTGMGGGGGGGFMSSLLGGMVGGAAGGWLYDQFSGRNSSSSWGSEQSHQVNDDPGFGGQDTDYSGSGGDFGGGDSGGGDSGGGDSGGSDNSSGGGGGDF